MSGRISSQKGWLGSGMGCQGRWWSLHSWNYLRDVYVVLRNVSFWCLVDFVTLKFFSNVDSVTL